MKGKRYKYIDDLIDDYIRLTDEQIEIPVLLEKAHKKYNQHLAAQSQNIYKAGEADDLFRIFSQIKKHEERRSEITQELTEVENVLKEFLNTLNNGKLAFERKDDDKSKNTYLFWLEDGQVKCNR